MARPYLGVVDCGMGTKKPTSGLLSRVAGFFREPGGGAQDSLDSVQTTTGENEKHALKALIERKRQDDLVRRREFNHLRKLRKLPRGVLPTVAGHSDRPSIFASSSGFGSEDRASTLKKIDAIEAHMVKSWARQKVGGLPPVTEIPTRSARPAAVATPAAPGPVASTGMSSAPAPTPKAAVPTLEVHDDLDLDFTAMLDEADPTEKDAWKAPAEAMDTVPMSLSPIVDAVPPPPAVRDDVDALVGYDLLAAQAIATEEAAPQLSPLDLGLQDAAVQFAEGDSPAAEAVLLGLLQQNDISPGGADLLASALFDLYRATGQQDGFDVVAMDYAERFGRSPGEWFCLPELLAHRAAVAVPVQSGKVVSRDQGAAWVCPALLVGDDVEALMARFSPTSAPWYVDWTGLQNIDPQAANLLASLLRVWCGHPIELHLSGRDALLGALQDKTPPNDNTADPVWWSMRLDALCILDRQDDFEGLALDFCVVYEVSPPSWKPALCKVYQEASVSAFQVLIEGPPSEYGTSEFGDAEQFARCELAGELEGDAESSIAQLQAASEASHHVVVSCALLMRVDFNAAGAILNWAAASDAEGCHVHFVQVPRLVAVFFHVLGIDRHAQITVRAN